MQPTASAVGKGDVSKKPRRGERILAIIQNSSRRVGEQNLTRALAAGEAKSKSGKNSGTTRRRTRLVNIPT